MYVITGGGTGIGRALALALAARKQHVLVIGRREIPLNEVSSHSTLISALPTDITSSHGRQTIVNFLQHTPSLDGLIHCAGVIKPIIPVLNIKEADWHALMSVNLDAPLFLTQALQHKLDHGRVLVILSRLADEPIKGLGAYCTSKAALKMLVRCWQMDDFAATMAVSGANPAIVDTDMPQQVVDAQYTDEQLRSTLRESKQLHQMLLPETVALFLTWLLLDTDRDLYASKTWDILDTSHHSYWLVPPHILPSLPPKT